MREDHFVEAISLVARRPGRAKEDIQAGRWTPLAAYQGLQITTPLGDPRREILKWLSRAVND